MRLILARLCLGLLLCASAACLVLPAAVAQEGLPQVPGGAGPQPPQASAAPGVDAKVDPAEDEAIARRLRTTYDTVDGLAPVQVRVTSGVVVLTGEVSAQALRQQAARLAANVRGVAEVENRIEVAQDLEGRLTPAVRRLSEVWTDFVRLLPVILLGLAIMAVALAVGRSLARLKGLYRRIAANAFIAGLLAQVVQTAVLLGGLALTMLLLDATGLIKTLLGAAGIVGLALGFALRDTVENYIASILLSVRRPFDPFDYVRIEGHEGMVIRLTSRATVLLNQDGNQIRIPNAVVFKGLIVNFTRRPQRRFAFSLGIAPGEDLGRAQRVAVEALARVDGVLPDPAPVALYERVGDSAVDMLVAGWMDQRSHDFLRVRSEAIRVVLTRMGAAHVDLPEPTLRLRRAPVPAREVEEAQPAMATGRDSTLDRAVEQERIRGQDGLEPSGREE
ncbi:MAG TPA: BON domain-containing protein [Rhodospirillales bacterium]|nr:BON domain-containing protein [Rhodospirillales bacterium]